MSVIIMLFFLVLLNLFYHLGFGNSYFKKPTVLTKPCGNVQGIREEDIYIFKGIPYAKPPVQELRWCSPQSLEKKDGSCWEGTFKATTFANECFQKYIDIVKYSGQEDCLYLNIWTPTLKKTAKLPVMVFIHGGSLMNLNSSVENYSPNADVTKQANMVFVSMNYRLNGFGFLTLDLLSKRSNNNKSGNYGLMDQIRALEWVKENIENFGGDAETVTIYGHSSGGSTVYALLTSPKAKGLFQRAWVQSGSPILNKTMDEASKDNLIFLNRSGCNDVECLLNLSPKEVADALPIGVYPYWDATDLNSLPIKGHFHGALLVIDGDVIPKPIIDAWESKEVNDVPIIISTTAQEPDFYIESEIMTGNWKTYKKTVAKYIDTFGKDLTKKAIILYPPLRNSTPEYQYSTIVTDVRLSCFTDIVAEKIASNVESPVYRLISTSSPSIRIPFLNIPFKGAYAFHGWDSYAFHGIIPKVIKNPSAKDLAFQKIIQENIFHFARTGKVKAKSWHPFQKSTALASDKLEIIKRYHVEECKFWISNGFGSYSWIN